MQKAGYVLLPIAALAILAFVFWRVYQRDAVTSGNSNEAAASKGGSRVSAADAEIARLKAELEALRKEKEAQKKRAEEAESKLATADGLEDSKTQPPDPKKEAAKKGEWKKRRDSELEAKVKSIEWRKRVKGLIDYWKELEKARAEGRAPQMSPEMTGQLMRLQSDAVELAKLLGLEADSPYKSFQNELVTEAWVDAFMQELTGGTLSEDQLAKLRLTDLYKDDGTSDDPNRNLLEQWHELIEHNRAYGTATLGILSQEQQAQVSAAVTPGFMLSVYAAYSERTLAGTGTTATESVSAYWQKSFQIPVEQTDAVQAIAAEYVRRQAEIAAALAAQYGGVKSREYEFDLLLKTLEAQMAAEKKLAESLQLTPEQLKLFQKGSGSVIKLGS